MPKDPNDVNGNGPVVPYVHTFNGTLYKAAKDYLDNISPTSPPAPAKIEEEILGSCASAIRMENALREKGEKWKIPQTLPPFVIALILLYVHHVVNIVEDDKKPEEGLLAYYCDDGINQGIYNCITSDLNNLIRQYNRRITNRELQDVIKILSDDAEHRIKRTTDPDLIPLHNGIFDYRTKQLLPFDPKYVFTWKSPVDYNPQAQNISIYNPEDNTYWNVEDWMNTLNNDPEVIKLLWQIIGAMLRPNVPWDQAAWFYSESGNSGKGTLCSLLRNIVGESACASISLSQFSKEFYLEQLTHCSAIVVDENDVGTYIDQAAGVKAVITHDKLTINRKYLNPICIRFRGMMVQCLNEMPRIKDKSDSFFRRQIFVPFDKCFTGSERKYIKEDYLHRKEVLEYVVYKVLNMDYYAFTVPTSCIDALETYREYNDPVRSFATEFLHRLVWDLVPYRFLYDLYKAWYKETQPNGTIAGLQSFTQDIMQVVNNKVVPGWYALGGGKKRIRTGAKMNKAEPLIDEYHLEQWMDPRYAKGRDLETKCHPILNNTYAGIIRDTATNVDADDDEDIN